MRMNKLKSTTVKKYLKDVSIDVLSSDELRNKYFVNPKSDFTRERKITFYKLLKYVFCRSAGTLTSTLQHFFGYGPQRPGNTKAVRDSDLYHYIQANFDYLPAKSPFIILFDFI